MPSAVARGGLFDNLNFANARQPASTEPRWLLPTEARSALVCSSISTVKKGGRRLFLAEQSHARLSTNDQVPKYKKRQAPKNKQAPNDKLQAQTAPVALEISNFELGICLSFGAWILVLSDAWILVLAYALG